jgi:uncharacterized protein (DUF885 family)
MGGRTTGQSRFSAVTRRTRAWRLGLLLPLLVLTGFSCTPPAPTVTPPAPGRRVEDTRDDSDIARAGQAYIDFIVATSPERATTLGLHSRDTELDDRTLKGFEAVLVREEKMLGELRARFAAPHASRSARTDLEILEHTLATDIRVKRVRRPLETQPDVYEAPLDALFEMTARTYAPPSERANNVLARLEKIPVVVRAAKANLKHPPHVWTEVAIERAKGAKDYFDDARGELVAALPGEEARVDRALGIARAAYADYAVFLEKDLLARSNGDYAAGPELFAFMLKEGYFLDESADELAVLGQRILSQTQEQMTALAKKIDPSAKGWPEITARLKANHPAAADLRAAYQREVERSKAFLVAHDVVPFPPGESCDVVDTPPFQRSTITAAYDESPPFDKESRGLFFVTPVDLTLTPEKQEQMLRENDHGDLVDTAVHETYPGHHLQISFERLYPSVVRKATATSLFEEGWALYAEELMSELGYYTDEERMMQLEWTLVRAARVLIDVGLHTRGMTFDQAVAILTNDVHLEKELALSEVKRYTMEPTQPLSYIVGREMIMKVRERYRREEKERFTLKHFHADVLSRGGIVPGLLAEEMFER